MGLAEAKAEATMAELNKVQKSAEEKHAKRLELADQEYQAQREKLSRQLATKREHVEQAKAALDAEERSVREECTRRMAALQNRADLSERQLQKKWEMETVAFENRVISMKQEAEEAAERYQAQVRGQNQQLQKE